MKIKDLKLKENFDINEIYINCVNTFDEYLDTNKFLGEDILNGKILKIGKLENNSEFREKMMKRKTRESKYKAISPDGEEFILDGFTKMIEQFNFNSTLVRKYKNTGNPVQKTDKQNNEKTLNTIGWIFYELKKD